MPKYEVVEISYIHNRLVQPGEIVDWEPKKHGTAGPNLKPLKSPVATVKAIPGNDPEGGNGEGGEGEGNNEGGDQ